MDDREKLALLILRDVLDVPARERPAHVLQRCGADPLLRSRVESLLHGIGADEADEPGIDAVDGSHARASVDALVGTRLGAFEVVERIGRGGMGVVYLGVRTDPGLEQQVALKLIRPGFDFDDIRARFLRERRILARLSHPNLARFIDGGIAPDGRPWFALEFVRGAPITHWCDARRIGVRARVRLFLDVCAAVQYAHAQLVVHRDLKPANVLVDDEGRIRLLDFGIARLVGGGDDDEAPTTTIGRHYAMTPEYAAPEQFSGEPAGVATDVYALGAILYEIVSGTLPVAVERGDLIAAAHAVSTTPPASLAGAIQRSGRAGATTPAERLASRATTDSAYRREVRGDLACILDRALAKEPARRYATVEAFADDLGRWLDGVPVRVSGNAFGYRLRKFVARNRIPVTLATVAAVTVAAGISGTLWQAHRADVAATAAKGDAARATAARDFLASLLGKASPESEGKPETTVREVLDRARARIASEFSAQPALRTEMSTLIGRTYNDLGEYADGLELLRESATLADADGRVPDGTRGAAHAELAYALLARNDAAEAEREATAAIALLRQQPDGDPLANALGTLATAQYLQARFAPALEAQRASIEVSRMVHGSDSEEYASAQMELSYFLAAGESPAQAVPVAQEALRVLERRYPDDDRPVVARALWALGNALSSVDRDAEAVPHLRRAGDMVGRIYGREGAKYMRSLQLLGVAELSSGDLPAARNDLSLAAHLVEAAAPDHPLAPLVHLYYAIALRRSGDAVGAEALAQRAATEAAKAGRNDVADRAVVVLARARSLLGREADAIATIDAALPGLRERRSSKLPLALAAKAEAQRRSGALGDATRTIADAVAVTGDLQSGGRVELLLEQARIARASGDPASAARQSREAQRLLVASGAQRAPEFAEAEDLAAPR